MPLSAPLHARVAAILGRRALDPVTICRALCATPTLAAMVAASMSQPKPAQVGQFSRTFIHQPPETIQ